MTDRLLDAKEAAELLGLKDRDGEPLTSWVLAQSRAGNIPTVRLGRYRRYRQSDLLAWVEALTEGGGPGWRKHRPQVAATTKGEE